MKSERKWSNDKEKTSSDNFWFSYESDIDYRHRWGVGGVERGARRSGVGGVGGVTLMQNAIRS